MDIERLKRLREAVFEDYRGYEVKNLKDEDGKVYPSTVPLDECHPIGKELIVLIDAEIARQSVTSEEVQRAIELLREPSKYMDYYWLDAQMHDALNLAITALQKIGTNTVDVAWTEAYQSYESAGDEAVPYCPKCDADIEDDQKFCKDCGVELIWSWDKEIE